MALLTPYGHKAHKKLKQKAQYLKDIMVHTQSLFLTPVGTDYVLLD